MANKKRRKPNQNRARQQPARAGARTDSRENPGAPARDAERDTRDARPEGPDVRPVGARRGPQQPQAGQRVRAEKKDLARRQREEIRKRAARKRRARRLLRVSVVAVAIAAAVLFLTRPKETTPTANLPGLLTTEAPWDANAAQAAARADATGLPAEGATMHIHANVQIFVHGQSEPVPTNIGITDTSGESLHTHEGSGTVHMESSVARTFTLGEFFDVWGVRLTPSCMGAYCNDSANTLQVFVNGQEQTGDPTKIAMNDHDVIVLTYGTAAELPNPIPSTFDFASVAP